MRRVVLFLMFLAIGACDDESPSSPTSMTAPFSGAWSGAYVIDRCQDTTTLGLCTALTTGPLTLTMVQAGTSLSAAIVLSTAVAGSTTGSVDSTGLATLGAYTVSGNVVSGQPPVLVRVSGWVLRVTDNRLTGTFHVNISSSGAAGSVDLDASLQDVTR